MTIVSDLPDMLQNAMFIKLPWMFFIFLPVFGDKDPRPLNRQNYDSKHTWYELKYESSQEDSADSLLSHATKLRMGPRLVFGEPSPNLTDGLPRSALSRRNSSQLLRNESFSSFCLPQICDPDIASFAESESNDVTILAEDEWAQIKKDAGFNEDEYLARADSVEEDAESAVRLISQEQLEAMTQGTVFETVKELYNKTRCSAPRSMAFLRTGDGSNGGREIGWDSATHHKIMHLNMPMGGTDDIVMSREGNYDVASFTIDPELFDQNAASLQEIEHAGADGLGPGSAMGWSDDMLSAVGNQMVRKSMAAGGEAGEDHLAGLEMCPENAADMASHARHLFRSHCDADAAEHWYRQALECDPDRAETLVELGLLLIDAWSAWARAEPLFDRALLLDPRNGFAGVGLAECRMRHRGDLPGAEALLLRALDPATRGFAPEPASDLARFWAGLGGGGGGGQAGVGGSGVRALAAGRDALRRAAAAAGRP